MKRIYLDYAATTPVDARVMAAMRPYFSAKFGNPGSLHFFGQEAITAVDKARETVARALGVPAPEGFRDVIFTGSATEANNLALRGVVRAFRAAHGKKYHAPRVLISSVEHESVRATCEDLAREGVEIISIPVDRAGMIDVDFVRRHLNIATALVSVAYVNNEIGTIQPIHEIAGIVEDFKERMVPAKTQSAHGARWPLIHTDAVQAFQYLDCSVHRLRVDMMTLSGHKMYGPKGVGALYIKNNELRIKNYEKEKSEPSPLIHNSNLIIPIITGGGQEFGLRSGTENVPAIVGFAEAVRLAVLRREKEAKRVTLLRDYFWNSLRREYKGAQLNGSATHRVANNLNVYFPDVSAADLLVKLDLLGVAVSAGSACASRAAKPSSTLLACGLPDHWIQSSVRFSLGAGTTKGQINDVVKRIQHALKVENSKIKA